MVRLSDREFGQFQSHVYQVTGIHLTAAKKTLLEGRLQKRLQAVKLATFSDYFRLVTSQAGRDEQVHMIDCVSTNKTDFFREPQHFRFLQDHVLPDYQRSGIGRQIKVWSAASSTGEEVYTLAMVLQRAMETGYLGDYRIWGSDISTRVLQIARQAIYPSRHALAIPAEFRTRYLLKSKDSAKDLIRVIAPLRAKVELLRINLMDDSFALPRDLDFVFCRNVLIYFDKPTQQKVIAKLLQHIKPKGYLFIGHSESLFQLNLPIRQVMPTVFQKN